jgi:hypothetical protein
MDGTCTCKDAYRASLPPPVLFCQQASVYGLGVCAQYGGALFAAQGAETLAVIHAIVNAPNAREDDNGFATDNAISALGKIILYQPEMLGANRAAAVQMFLGYLPVVVDEEEGNKEHGCLCSLLERGEPALFEQPAQTIPQLMKVSASPPRVPAAVRGIALLVHFCAHVPEMCMLPEMCPKCARNVYVVSV